MDPNRTTADFLRRINAERHDVAVIHPELPNGHPEKIKAGTFNDAQEAVDAGLRRNEEGRNVYYSIAEIRQDLEHKRASKDDIVASRWVWTECDPVDPRLDLVAVKAAMRAALKRTSLPEPTLVVDSGRGLWFLWEIERTEDLDRVEAVNKAIIAEINRHADGFHADSACSNRDRIARMPGTKNFPDAKKRAKGWTSTLDAVWLEDTGVVHALEKFPDTVDAPAEERVAFAIPGDLPMFEDADALRKAGYSDETIEVAMHGWSKSKGTPEPKDSDRSVQTYKFAAMALDDGVATRDIAAVLMDKRWMISAHVHDEDDSERAVARAIGAAKLEHDNAVIVSRGNPTETARQFVERETPNLVRLGGDWLDFDGAGYMDIEDGAIAAAVRAFLDGAKTKDTKGRLRPFLPKRNDKNEVVDALRDVTLRERGRFDPPCWLDGNGPPAQEILACRNALVHLPTGRAQEPTPRFFTRNALAFDYDASANEPIEWLKFLDSVWGDDPEQIALLQEVMGYSLLPDTSQQKIFVIVGPTRSGKGTIGRVLQSLVGRANCCAPTLNQLGGNFGRQSMLHKTVALISDARLGHRSDRGAIVETLLSISGEDTVEVDVKYKAPWIGKLSVRLWLMLNELPALRDVSGALANRFVPMTMTRSFLGSEDLALGSRLEAELPAILLWAIEGWKRLRERGHFVLPESSREQIQAMEVVGSPVGSFLVEECVLRPDGAVAKDTLYDRWLSWSLDRSIPTKDKAVFIRDLISASKGQVSTGQSSSDGVRTNVLKGLVLVDRSASTQQELYAQAMQRVDKGS